MAPSQLTSPGPPVAQRLSTRAITADPVEGSYSHIQLIVEAWAQGFHVGAIVILILITLCNYRRNILLHKLILLELTLALWHGFFIFFKDPAFGWVLSGSAVPLYVSYTLHNVISWLKIKPFLPRWGGHAFIISLAIVQPYWIVETWANFSYFNLLGNNVFKESRFFEPLARDPWWIFTTVKLVLIINKNYELSIRGLVNTSPRFGIMLLCMLMSIIFLVTDVIVTALVSTQSGINPFWRFALVFKCASDTIFLDDFKSVLDRIAESAIRRIVDGPSSFTGAGNLSSVKAGGGHASHVQFQHGRSGSTAAAAAEKAPDTAQRSGMRGWATSKLTSSRSEDSGEERMLSTGAMAEPGQGKSSSSTSGSDFIMEDALGTRPDDYHTGGPDPRPRRGEFSYLEDGIDDIPMAPMRARLQDQEFVFR